MSTKILFWAYFTRQHFVLKLWRNRGWGYMAKLQVFPESIIINNEIIQNIAITTKSIILETRFQDMFMNYFDVQALNLVFNHVRIKISAYKGHDSNQYKILLQIISRSYNSRVCRDTHNFHVRFWISCMQN
jgi:hypothetical protein